MLDGMDGRRDTRKAATLANFIFGSMLSTWLPLVVVKKVIKCRIFLIKQVDWNEKTITYRSNLDKQTPPKTERSQPGWLPR